MDAMSYLEDIGSFEEIETGRFRLTAQERDCWKRLKDPRRYWFLYNRFRLSVLVVTILLSAIGAKSGIFNLAL